MKRTILTFVLIFLGWYFVGAQEQEAPKWRTLTLSTVSFQDIAQDTQLTSFSAGLDYEIGSNWWVTSWNQFQVNHTTSAQWFATMSTVDYRFDSGLTVGAGYLYFEGSQAALFAPTTKDTQSMVAVKLAYRIKL